MRTTTQLLWDFAQLLNEHGPTSKPVRRFLVEYSTNAEFRELAILAIALKKIFIARHAKTIEKK